MSANTFRKRARTHYGEDGDRDDTTNGSPSSSIQRDQDVWFSDGNIVIIAAKEVAFRVHKGTLSLRSELFRDMFSLPQVDAAKTFDGCPAVDIEDSPQDIRPLLLVICCGKNYYYNQDALVPVPFSILASLTRMAHKYMIQDVLDDALSRLKKYYTNNLATWQDPAARARYVTAADADAPTAVELARLTGTPSLLPTAFLECMALTTQYRTNADGSFHYPAGALAVPDQVRAIAARGHLAQACAARAFALVAAAPSPGCTAFKECTEVREAPLDALWEDDGMPPVTSENALRPLAERLWGREQWGRFCVNCRRALLNADAGEVRNVWQNLPSHFDLEIGEDVWPGGVGGAGGA